MWFVSGIIFTSAAKVIFCFLDSGRRCHMDTMRNSIFARPFPCHRCRSRIINRALRDLYRKLRLPRMEAMTDGSLAPLNRTFYNRLITSFPFVSCSQVQPTTNPLSS